MNYFSFSVEFEGDNLLAQSISYFVAGLEATSTAIAFTLQEISLNPEIEEQLYKEIKENVTGTQLNLEVINKMTFLDKVVNESLRLYPPLPIIDRVAVRDYQVLIDFFKVIFKKLYLFAKIIFIYLLFKL